MPSGSLRHFGNLPLSVSVPFGSRLFALFSYIPYTAYLFIYLFIYLYLVIYLFIYLLYSILFYFILFRLHCILFLFI